MLVKDLGPGGNITFDRPSTADEHKGGDAVPKLKTGTSCPEGVRCLESILSFAMLAFVVEKLLQDGAVDRQMALGNGCSLRRTPATILSQPVLEVGPNII
jgi:hypothetical protein